MERTRASDGVRGSEIGRGPTQKPRLVIVPGSTPLLQYARDFWHHRDLVSVLAVREIKLRYRQTALGAIWVVLQPLLSAGILSFIFGRVAKLPTQGIPSFVYTYAGMLAWTAFSQSLSRATNSLVNNSGLVSKIFFPRLILPLSTLLALVVDFFVTLVVMIVLLYTNDLAPDARILLLPVFLLLFLMLSQGVGAFLASLAVRYRDIPQITPVMVQLLLYASPVAYSVSAVPSQYLGLYYLNPLVGLLEAFRWSLVGTPFPSAAHFAYSLTVTITLFAVGMVALEKMERTFADVI